MEIIKMKDVTKRRQIRIDKKEEEKSLISLWKKKMKLLEGKRSFNKVELPKPERWGYKRFFILRDDIAKSRDSLFYNQLLVHIQNVILSRDKKFEYKDYKTKKRLPIHQELKPIDHKDWNKLIKDGKLSDKQQACFQQVWKQNKFGKGGSYVFEFTKPWMFVLRTEPYYLTHRTVVNPQLESELRELSNKIDSQNLMPKISKVMGWSNGYHEFKNVIQSIILKETIKEIKEELGDIIIHFD